MGFIRNCKKEGPPTLNSYSAQIIKRDYIMEPEPNPLQELQIKEKEKSMEKSKTETKIPQQNYRQETVQPAKEKIMINPKDIKQNKIIREKPSLEPKEPEISKARMKRRKEQEIITQIKKDNKPNNQCSTTLLMKNLGIQDKKCEEPSKETDIQYITQSQYNNVCLPNMSENSSSISPSHQINTENQSNDDTGIIHSNHIKIDPKEEIAEIKIETDSITTKSNLENSQKMNKRKVEKQEDEQLKV